jgi:hypothetical protein
MPELAAERILIDDAVLQEVAAELAREIYPLDDILQRFKVAPDVFDRIRRTHHFQRMHAEALITWQSSTNARERTRLKSEVMVEKMLEPGWRAFQDPGQPLAARVQMMQTVAKLAGLLDTKGEAPAAAIAPGDKVSITINLSQPPPHYAQGGHNTSPVITIEKDQLDLPASDPVEVLMEATPKSSP